MADRKKVITGLECCSVKQSCSECPWKGLDCNDRLHLAALELLKENDIGLERIYQNICAYINDGCSTDTKADKQYVCEMIGRIFEGKPVLLDEEVEQE